MSGKNPGTVIGLSIPTKGVTVTYNGNTDLKIEPAIGTTSTAKKGDSITIDKSSEGNDFKANGVTVATVWNRDDVDKVEITGGTNVGGTSPFTITVKLT